MIITQMTGSHVAYINPVAQVGLLVEPPARDDIDSPVTIWEGGVSMTPMSLFAAELRQAVAWLKERGYYVVVNEDDPDGNEWLARLPDGRTIWLIDHPESTDNEEDRLNAFDVLLAGTHGDIG